MLNTNNSVINDVIDKGLDGVTVCSTKLSTIHESELFYRGYKIDDLVKYSSYLEVIFLLWEGRLPTKKDWDLFQRDSSEYMNLSNSEKKILEALPTESVHPMAWLRTAVSALALLEKEEVSFHNLESFKKLALKILIKTPLLVGFFHCLRSKNTFLDPNRNKSLAWNFLYIINGKEPSEDMVKIFDACLILHADHSLNCSTFSARITSSSLSDVFSAITSAIGTLKGPLHGGANEQVMKMLAQFRSTEEALDFIKKALSEKQKIMGFGHRIYKIKDPRAKILKEMGRDLTKQSNKSELFEMSEAMENLVWEEKKLPPNVDFYSASVYHCLNLETDLFTPIFACSRMGGWLAHIREQYSKNRIYRPKSKWLGNFNEKWKSISER